MHFIKMIAILFRRKARVSLPIGCQVDVCWYWNITQTRWVIMRNTAGNRFQMTPKSSLGRNRIISSLKSIVALSFSSISLRIHSSFLWQILRFACFVDNRQDGIINSRVWDQHKQRTWLAKWKEFRSQLPGELWWLFWLEIFQHRFPVFSRVSSSLPCLPAFQV